jgi:hypothetical protein
VSIFPTFVSIHYSHPAWFSLFRRLLRFAEHKDLVDHDNFLAFGVGLSFLVLGIVGMIGSDDILWLVKTYV